MPGGHPVWPGAADIQGRTEFGCPVERAAHPAQRGIHGVLDHVLYLHERRAPGGDIDAKLAEGMLAALAYLLDAGSGNAVVLGEAAQAIAHQRGGQLERDRFREPVRLLLGELAPGPIGVGEVRREESAIGPEDADGAEQPLCGLPEQGLRPWRGAV